MLIGILGRKRVGKDTSADYLIEKYDYQKIAFATPIKEACKLLFNFSEEDLINKDIIHPQWGVTPRTLIKWVGTDIFRIKIQEILPDVEDKFWAIKCINKCGTLNGNVVISDVRHQNEIDKIRDNNGIIIKIINKNAEKDPDEDHIDALEGDYTIYNESEYNQLYEKLDDIIKKII